MFGFSFLYRFRIVFFLVFLLAAIAQGLSSEWGWMFISVIFCAVCAGMIVHGLRPKRPDYVDPGNLPVILAAAGGAEQTISNTHLLALPAPNGGYDVAVMTGKMGQHAWTHVKNVQEAAVFFQQYEAYRLGWSAPDQLLIQTYRD